MSSFSSPETVLSSASLDLSRWISHHKNLDKQRLKAMQHSLQVFRLLRDPKTSAKVLLNIWKDSSIVKDSDCFQAFAAHPHCPDSILSELSQLPPFFLSQFVVSQKTKVRTAIRK